MDFKPLKEKPYDECTREELIEGMEIKDHNFKIMAEEYLRITEGFNQLFMHIMNESMQTAKKYQTEMTLTMAGVPSENNEEVLVTRGKMEAYKLVMDYLLQLQTNQNQNNGN
jgi:hypothetical protein